MGGAEARVSRVDAAVAERPWLVSLAVALAFLPLKLFGFEVSYLNIHAARDWERGWQMLHGQAMWFHGPELLFRGTIPGGFFNLLTGLTQIPHRNPFLAAMVPPVLFCGAIFFFHDAGRRLFGQRAALVAALAMGLFPLGTISLRYVWNPAYMYIFGSVALWCLARAFAERRPGFVAGALASLLLASQIHLTGYGGVLAVVVIAAVFRLWPGWRPLLAVALLHGAFLLPYYVSQWMGDWPDRAAHELTRVNLDMDVMRMRPNPYFWLPWGMQFLVQPPLDRMGLEQTFPFSYLERFHQSARWHSQLGLAAFWASLPVGLLMLAGAVRGWVGRRSGLEPERRRFLAACCLYILIVSSPQFFWNPVAKGMYVENFGVPTRYFYILWPAQFFLLAGGLHWLWGRWRWAAAALVAPGLLLNAWLTVAFHVEARRTGEPFNYLTQRGWPVHALRDKVALASFLVEKYGMTEEVLLKRVHTEGKLLLFTEESLDYELRAALESMPDHPAADMTLYYFIYRPENDARIVGRFEEVERKRFGGLAVMVYRPKIDLSRWQPDAPISWWWY